MDIERRWVYDRVASPGEAGGRTCIFCHSRIGDGSQAGYWQLKAIEDVEDADFVVEDGFAHHDCTQEELAKSRRSRYTLPEVPRGPRDA